MSTHAIFRPPAPHNEPVHDYAPGNPERESLQRRLDQMRGERIEVPLVIGGKDVTTGDLKQAVMPHDKSHVLADVHQGGAEHVEQAINAAATAWEDWSRWPWEERAAVLLRAAELLSGPWRDTLNAATMLGQSKTAHQAEIDAACESIDFFRFNVEFMTRIYAEQPVSSPGIWNRMEYRPLEGFVFAVSPFNFTAIAANLTTSAALMGNVVVWKPAGTAMLSAYYLMRLLQEAGPAGRRDQPRLRPGRDDRRRGALEPAPRRRALHRLDPRLQRHVADGRVEHGALPELPAHRRRDRRQGLHRRPPVRRRRRARDRDRPRLVRVPGPEVLRVLAGLRAVEPLAGAPRAAAGAGRVDPDGRRLRLPQLHGRRDRRQRRSRRRPTRSRRRRRAATRTSSSAAATTTRSATSSSRPSSRRATRSSARCARSSSAPS